MGTQTPPAAPLDALSLHLPDLVKVVPGRQDGSRRPADRRRGAERGGNLGLIEAPAPPPVADDEQAHGLSGMGSRRGDGEGGRRGDGKHADDSKGRRLPGGRPRWCLWHALLLGVRAVDAERHPLHRCAE